LRDSKDFGRATLGNCLERRSLRTGLVAEIKNQRRQILDLQISDEADPSPHKKTQIKIAQQDLKIAEQELEILLLKLESKNAESEEGKREINQRIAHKELLLNTLLQSQIAGSYLTHTHSLIPLSLLLPLRRFTFTCCPPPPTPSQC
jgi:hypothetical protein